MKKHFKVGDWVVKDPRFIFDDGRALVERVEETKHGQHVFVRWEDGYDDLGLPYHAGWFILV